MLLKGIIDEDFINFKYCSMLVSFPTCNWKCGKKNCHNLELAASPNIEISFEEIVNRYM